MSAISTTLSIQGQPDRRHAALQDLRATTRGRMLTPSDPDWDAARLGFNLTVNQQPLAVLEVADVTDIQSAVKVAIAYDLTVSVQPTGHGATTAVDDTILLRTRALDGIEIDLSSGTARVEAGVKWGAFQHAVDGTGLSGLAGSTGDVSVVGYTLGGGLSWFGRKFGWAANLVRRFEIVDAQGTRRTVTNRSDPEMFWALRGGGGDFAIVTAIEFELVPAPHVYGGRMMWPLEMAPRVLSTFAEVTETAPEELSVWALLFRFPDVDLVPEPVRGGSFVIIDATYLGDTAEGERLLEPFRDLGPRFLDTFGIVPVGMLDTIAAEPTDPIPAIEGGFMLSSFDEDVVQTLLELAGPGVETNVSAVQVRHLGGALARPSTGQGAIGAMAAPYSLLAAGLALAPELAPAVVADVRTFDAAMWPFRADRSYFNLLNGTDPTDAFDSETLERLNDIKRRRDPRGVIRSNRPLVY